MEITLEKIELVKDRTGATYSEAKDALEEADGSVVDAIIAIEENINREFQDDMENPLFHKVKEMGDKMDINAVVDKAKEVAEKGLELGKEYASKIDKDKVTEVADKAVELGKKGLDKASEYVNKETLTEAYDKAKDYAGVAVEKGKELYQIGLDMAEEYQVKEKVENFIGMVGEKAERINDAKAATAAKDAAIYADAEVVSEEDEQ